MLRISLHTGLISLTLLFPLLVSAAVAQAADPEPSRESASLDYDIKLETILKHDDGKFIWFHPRATPIPKRGSGDQPAVLLTLQKHLKTSDHYSGLHVMHKSGPGQPWTKPDPRPELDWRKESDDVTIAVCDVTPGWHAPTGKVIAIGSTVRYDQQGHQLYEKPRSIEAAYAVYDPPSKQWTSWRMLELSESETKFYLATPGCVQWHVKSDGTLLVPVYFSGSAKFEFSTTVFHCAFDGTTLRYLRHGDELVLKKVRGLYEPSIAHYRGKYFLTIRNDLKGYVTTGDDGLHYQPVQPWTFDDGAELGSYNTQQHWLTHSDGLFLVYTRRGANNDHITRHRAPLFIARVDPKKLVVIRKTERVLIPQRGATLGNFGATTINENESWVTVSEGLFGQARKHGADGSTFIARIRWSRPNKLAPTPHQPRSP